MAIQISGTTVIDDSRRGIFSSISFGSFATGSEPASPSIGDVIYNTTDAALKVWNGSSWESTK